MKVMHVSFFYQHHDFRVPLKFLDDIGFLLAWEELISQCKMSVDSLTDESTQLTVNSLQQAVNRKLSNINGRQ